MGKHVYCSFNEDTAFFSHPEATENMNLGREGERKGYGGRGLGEDKGTLQIKLHV
jgi:hypothetical protein